MDNSPYLDQPKRTELEAAAALTAKRYAEACALAKAGRVSLGELDAVRSRYNRAAAALTAARVNEGSIKP